MIYNAYYQPETIINLFSIMFHGIIQGMQFVYIIITIYVYIYIVIIRYIIRYMIIDT